MTILSEIFAHKRTEVKAQKAAVPLPELLEQIEAARPPLNFAYVLRPEGRVALIAEVKKGSPSRGVMVKDFDPVRLAQAYAANGAAAISVLTDEKYFGGSLNYLKQIADLNLGIPLLRKEFTCDFYQIYEARAAGADAILLIVAELSDHQLSIFQSLARKLGMTALVEVHTYPELVRALRCGANVIGINNRNLHDFSVSLDTTRQLRPTLPPHVTVVAESGISQPTDLQDLNVDAILVGEALVRADDLAQKVRQLASIPSQTPAQQPQASDY
jgi:indole-3-glycerol phosphate synthase